MQNKKTHTHACRLFTPTHTLLPPCYSQLVVIPRLSQNSTISLSIRFMPNLMSPCRTCFLQRMWALQTVATARFTRTLAPFLITCKSRWQLEMHFAKSGSHSYQSAAYALNNPSPVSPSSLSSHLYQSPPWQDPVSVNCSICCLSVFTFATTVYLANFTWW